MNNDTIYRQAAIDALDVGAELLRRALDDADIVGVERGTFKWELELIEACISDMKELPSAQQERPTGEWIVSESEEVGALGVRCRTYTCPSCGWNHSLIIQMNFCPNCGNDNRGEQDE